MKRLGLAACGGLCALLPASAAAPPRPQADTVRIDSSERLALRDLIEQAQQELGAAAVVVAIPKDRLDLQVPLWGSVELPRTASLGFLERLLYAMDVIHAEVATPEGTLHEFHTIGMGGALLKGLARFVPAEEAERMNDRALLITTTVATRHIAARDGVNALQPYFSDSFTDNLRNVEGTSSIVFTGPAFRVASALELLRALDRPSGENSSEDLAALLTSLEAAATALERHVRECPGVEDR